MSELDVMFRDKLHIDHNKKLTFVDLDHILSRMAATFPFENLCLWQGRIGPITQQTLIEKMLVRGEGGLCYELNPLLYYFLAENGFDVQLVRANVYNHAQQNWSLTGWTHVAILLQEQGESYLLDAGFGGNVPLTPVPLNGDTVSSRNGQFRVIATEVALRGAGRDVGHGAGGGEAGEAGGGNAERDGSGESEGDLVETPHGKLGDLVLQSKLHHKDEDWKIGYMFESRRPLPDLTEINDIQYLIANSEHSNFNKGPLIVQLTDDGNITLTRHSFTQWVNGEQSKLEIDDAQFKQLAKQHFGFDL